MAITRHIAELILAEHSFRPINGRVLLLGRQTVFMTPDEAVALVHKVGMSVRPKATIEICRMRHGNHYGYISDASFFSLFSDADVKACDITDYEGAEYIFDLSTEPPVALLASFDFIYNGSVLDNVFDPAKCLRNASRMLKPTGSIMHYEGQVHWSPAYLKMSPDWFFDYYAVNGFADAQAYVCSAKDFHASPWQVFEWNAFVDADNHILPGSLPGPDDQFVFSVAENCQSATVDQTPIQSVYRPDHGAYLEVFNRANVSARRLHYRKVISASNPAANVAVVGQPSFLGFGGTKPVAIPQGLHHVGALGLPRHPEIWF